MTREQYIAIFTKHLRVGDPVRTSIMTELNGHIDELPEHAYLIDSLGYPIDLARAYNRTHLGVWHSFILTLSAPFLILFVVMLGLFVARFFGEGLFRHYCELSPGNGTCVMPWWVTVIQYAPLAGLGIAILLFGSMVRSQVRTKTPWRLMSVILALTVGLWTAAMTYPEYLSQKGMLDPNVITHNPQTYAVELRDPRTGALIPDADLKNYTIGKSTPTIIVRMIPFALGIASFFAVFTAAEYGRRRWINRSSPTSLPLSKS